MLGHTSGMGGPGSTLDDEIDEWEQEQLRQQHAWEQEQERSFAADRNTETKRMREQQAKEAAILRRLLGPPSSSAGRPPSRWAKPETKFHFFSESEFLRRTPRLSETILSPDRKHAHRPAFLTDPERKGREEGEAMLPPGHRQVHAATHGSEIPSSALGTSDWLQPDAVKKPRTPKLRRTRSNLHSIQEVVGDEERERGRDTERQHRTAEARSVDRGPASRGSRGSSQASSREAGSTVRVLISAMKGSSLQRSRSSTPQTPQMARKYGEFSASVASWGWASATHRAGSRGGAQNEADGKSHVDGDSERSQEFPRTAGADGRNPVGGYDSLNEGENTSHPPSIQVETIKLFNDKTGKWRTEFDELAQAYKDPAGHGNTVYPRIPQFFDDPAYTIADALLNAKTSEEKRMLLDQVAIDLRPGSFQAGVLDYEASVGLVLTDEYHGVMIDLIEAGSSAAESKSVSSGDYILEVDKSDVSQRSADQVENMLMGKEGTTVEIVLQTEHFGKPRNITLMRKSASAGLKEAPKEFFRKEEEMIWSCGYNEFGQLNHGNFSDTSAAVLCEKKKLARWDLRGRIHTISCGWYHTVIVARQRWSTAKPIEFNKTQLKDPNVISTEEIVTALAHWATPKFRRTARRDTELPDDPEEFMEQFDRKEIVSMYMRMVESGQYGSAKKNWCTLSCGLNKSGQLGLGHKDNLNSIEPIEMLIGEKVDLVACGGHHTLLLMQTGTVLAFGANRHGQLGNGTVFDASTPQIVPALTHESTRNPKMPTPSRVLLVTNLEPYIGTKDIVRNFSTCFGYQHTMLRGWDRTTVPGPDAEEKMQPCALVFFIDTITSAHAMKKYQGKMAGEQFLKLPMNIHFFHPHQAGTDWLAWIATKAYRSSCVVPIGSYVKQIAAGYDHSVALLSNGQVVGWGHNNWGQVGTPPQSGIDPEIILRMTELPDDAHLIQIQPVVLQFTRKASPGEPNMTRPQKVKLIAVGGNHNLFLIEDGRVMTCGRNDNMQLGLGSSSGKVYHQVVEITDLNKYDVRTVCAGASHSIAVLHDGRVFSWGRNNNFQCGHYDQGTLDIALPREILAVTKAGRPVVHIAANEHTMLVCQDYEVFCWGLNDHGQLGLAHRDRIHRRLEQPKWASRGIRCIALTGAFHSFIFNRMPLVSGAYQYENCAYSWGYNKHGELGLGVTTGDYKSISVGSKTPALIPYLHMREIEMFSCGWYHTLCIYYDQRDLREGVPPPSSASESVQPAGFAAAKLLPKTPVKNRADDGYWTSLISPKPRKQHLVGWGYNRRGQLGLGHSEPQHMPVTIDLEKWGVETRIVQICCGGMSSYIVTENQDVFAFGNNSKGQLGIGEIGGRQKTPVKVSKLCGKGVRSISAGYDHCLALLSHLGRTAVYAWGANAYRQLGLGNDDQGVHTPTLVPALSKIHVKAVVCGGQHTIAVAPSSVWSMGRNDFGQLGLGHSKLALVSPQKIQFLSHATEAKTTNFVACGASHSLFVLVNGEMLGCGRNDSGQLGLGHMQAVVNRPTWILTHKMLNGHAVTGVAAGDHTLVSLSSGEIVGCGSNHNGQLGLGHTIRTADLQTLPLDSMRADVRAGAFHTFVSYGGMHPRRARNASAAAATSSLCRIS